jgi:hypothetical protein
MDIGRDGPMSEHIAQPITEMVAQARHYSVSFSAGRASVATVFDQYHSGVWVANDVIPRCVYRRI